jgi:uncharacterized protein (TIGR02996 family)
MSKEDALLQAVLAEPDADSPRLAYARWLEGHGRPERAEFIRVQVELARLAYDDPQRRLLEEGEHQGWLDGPDSDWLRLLRDRLTEAYPQRCGLELREQALLAEYGEEWAAPLRGLALRHWFRRGFVEEVEVDLEHFLASGRELFGRAPVRQARITTAGDLLTPALTVFSPVAGLAALDLLCNDVGDDGVAALAGSPYLAGLAALNLSGNRVGDRGLQALAGSRRLAGLADVHLGDNRIGPAGAAALAGSPLQAGLAALDLSHNDIGDEAVRALVSGGLARPRLLNLYATGMTPEGMGLLARSPTLSGVKSLDVGGNHFGDEGVRLLAASPGAAGLTTLGLDCSSVRPSGVRALAGSPFLGGLTSLDLDTNYVEDEGAATLAASPRLAGLCRLVLSSCSVGDEGARALADSPYLRGLRLLDMTYNDLTDAGRLVLWEAFGSRVRL